jgi:hypothetical protein
LRVTRQRKAAYVRAANRKKQTLAAWCFDALDREARSNENLFCILVAAVSLLAFDNYRLNQAAREATAQTEEALRVLAQFSLGSAFARGEKIRHQFSLRFDSRHPCGC